MKYILLLLILFITLNTLIKLSFWKYWQVAILAAIAGLFVIAVAPAAASQSKTQLTAWLQTPSIMQNLAVLITFETIINLTFAFIRLRKVLGTKVKPYVIYPLNTYPGLLLFPVLFYTLAQLFYQLPGYGFTVVATTYAAGIFVVMQLLIWGLKKIAPEDDLRLEILFIINLFVCIIGLISTVNGETAYAPVKQELDLKSILLALAFFALLFIIGLLRQRYRKLKSE